MSGTGHGERQVDHMSHEQPSSTWDEPETPAVIAEPRARTSVTFEPGNLWRTGLVALSVVALGAFLWFVLDDGGAVIFTLLISWFAALAMEPAVAKLGGRMKRGAATGVVMLSAGLFLVLFGLAFGNLIAEQLMQAAKMLPSFAEDLAGGSTGSSARTTPATRCSRPPGSPRTPLPGGARSSSVARSA